MPQLHPYGDLTARFKHVEIEICTICDTSCFGCDRLSDVASKGVPNMTVEQVARFVDESIWLEWEWERIRLLGGEPTLHPQFTEMVEQLLRYRRWLWGFQGNSAIKIETRDGPGVFLQVLTNGLGRAAKYREWLGSVGVNLHAEAKERGVTPVWFRNTRVVPVDRDPSVGELPPCGIFGERGCGVALTNHGYFLDGAGASTARVAGYDIGLSSLKEVTMAAMLEQAKVLCRVCGHHNPMDGPEVTKQITETGEVTGKWWTERLAEYNKNRPVLKVYGD